MNRFLDRFCMLAAGAAMLAPGEVLALHVMGGKVPAPTVTAAAAGFPS
jgi:hypothetical protein